MRKVYGVFAYLVAAEVVIQAMAIAYALAGLGKWIADDGGVLNKAVLDSDNGPEFPGVGGFALHFLNGFMLIPVLLLILLILSFFTKLKSASIRALVLLGLVILQVILGLTSHSVPQLIWLHVINAFAIFMGALMTGRWAFTEATTPASEPVTAP